MMIARNLGHGRIRDYSHLVQVGFCRRFGHKRVLSSSVFQSPGLKLNFHYRFIGSQAVTASTSGILRPQLVGQNWLPPSSSYGERLPDSNDDIFVAMSSGVDSSTTAALLAEKYPGKVHGIYMCNWTATARCTEAEWSDVQKVCEVINIPCHRVNLERDYWIRVFEPMIQLYRSGLTPNPDVGCNRDIKFGALLDWISDNRTRLTGSNQNWWLATGHYAKLGFSNNNSVHLLRPKDINKDQSYYLSTVLPESLNRVLFPLADYTKPEIRQMAIDFGLPTASKPDSQGLCFVSQDHVHFKDFLGEYVESTPGDVVTETGKIVGTHKGLWQATIGQRSGISMPQGDPECRGVWYVSDKDMSKNQIIIVQGRDHPSLYRQRATCLKFRWLGNDISLNNTKDCLSSIRVQFRSLQDQGLKVKSIHYFNGIPGIDSITKLEVIFDEPVRAVAPGQYLVIYQNDRVLGSGMIDFSD